MPILGSVCMCGHHAIIHNNEIGNNGCNAEGCNCRSFVLRSKPFSITKRDPSEDIIEPSGIDPHIDKMLNDLNEHIEMYAAAFMQLTKLPADKVVMKSWQKWENGHWCR